jgi:hypothetical protein
MFLSGRIFDGLGEQDTARRELFTSSRLASTSRSLITRMSSQQSAPLQHRLDHSALVHIMEGILHLACRIHLAEPINGKVSLLMQLDQLRDELVRVKVSNVLGIRELIKIGSHT